MASQLARRTIVASKGINVSLMLGLSSAASGTVVTLCESNDEGVMDKLQNMITKDKEGSIDWNGTLDKLASEVGNQAQSVIETGVPTQVSYGFLSGFCAGYALKKAGRAAAVVVGMGFMAMQTLSYSGYIKVDHAQMKKDVENLMDLNKDGKVNKEDGQQALDKLMEVFQYNLPSGGGFGVGFLGGLRSG